MWEQLSWNSNINKGYSLIEVICSITVFSILFITILSIQLNNLKLKKTSNEIHNNTIFMEAAKNNIIYNCSYDEIQKLALENRYYISKENIQEDKIKEKGITNLFAQDKPSEEPYIAIDIEQGKVLKLNLKLYTKIKDNTKVMECEIYKGKYKR